MQIKNTFSRIKEFCSYYLKTRFKFNIHSPFVYDFVDNVLDDTKVYPDYELIEGIRYNMLNDDRKITKTDYGSPKKSAKAVIKKIRISKIAKNSSVDPEEGQLLYRLIRYYKPIHILELGTSLGISTFYQALGAKEYHPNLFNSIEGCPEIHNIAKNNLSQIMEQEKHIDYTKLVQGAFDEVLPDLIKEYPTIDYVFFDGNHNLEPVIRYFELCLQKVNDESIFVFDDIYHSRHMKKAWKYIKKHEKVRTTVDLYRLGIVFFNNRYAKQDFTIRF